MTRAALIALVALGAYGALNLAFSIAVALLWRSGVVDQRAAVSRVRAQALVALRAAPCVAAAFITLVIVTPAFAIFEPDNALETVGPVLMLLAIAAVAQIVMALLLAASTIVRIRTVTRAWLRSGTPLTVHPPAGVPVYAIESHSPIVALVGVFSPKLIAARAVIDACTTDELTSIVAHERGHLHARDNFKRWLMACVPDALRWTPVHHEIAEAWHDAAEDAADDVATGGDDRARANLAALLVKIARLTPEPEWSAATVSPFVEKDGLPRRVRRLLDAAAPATTDARLAVPVATAVFTAVLIAALSSPAALKAAFDAVEALVALGR